jgi:hypothetical protein
MSPPSKIFMNSIVSQAMRHTVNKAPIHLTTSAFVSLAPGKCSDQIAFWNVEVAVDEITAFWCVSAWNKDPIIGVIGVQTGPQ